VVRPAARGAPGLRRAHAGARHRGRAPPAVGRLRAGDGPPLALLAVRRRPRHLLPRRHLRPHGRGGLPQVGAVRRATEG
jgi:hypothetical protein